MANIRPHRFSYPTRSLDLILAGSTSILIAHHLSTVKAADRIVVMGHGAILEEGDHEGLLAQGGYYAALYNTYFQHQSLDYRPDWVDNRGRTKLHIALDPQDSN